MSASAPFAHVFSAKLEDGRNQVQDSVVTEGTIRTHPCGPAEDWSVYRGGCHVGAGAYAEFASSARRGRRAPTQITSLSSEQRDALTAFRKLGAPLPDDFDAGRLKASFRRLALELHPDRHPGASPQRREWLGVRFAVLCEAHRTLSGAR